MKYIDPRRVSVTGPGMTTGIISDAPDLRCNRVGEHQPHEWHLNIKLLPEANGPRFCDGRHIPGSAA